MGNHALFVLTTARTDRYSDGYQATVFAAFLTTKTPDDHRHRRTAAVDDHPVPTSYHLQLPVAYGAHACLITSYMQFSASSSSIRYLVISIIAIFTPIGPLYLAV